MDNDPIARALIAGEPGRLRGALLGLAVGDALGTTLEFQTLAAPPFPQRATGPHRDIVGGGPFQVAPGQVTDDTQMACCLFRSLLDRRGLDTGDVAGRYVAWMAHAFDIGAQTAAALDHAARGMEPGEAGRTTWEARGRQAAGNGSLMRTAPIGALLCADEELRRDAALADSAITHFDPRCQLACAAFDAAIARALRRESARPADLLTAARADIEISARVLSERHRDLGAVIDEARASLHADLEAAERDDPGLYSAELHLHRHQGFVRIAFRLAFWELVHAPSYEDALIDVVNRGGDADTNGAIAGALLGALHGVDAIPRPWLDTVLGALADAPPSPLRDDYHPRVLERGLPG